MARTLMLMMLMISFLSFSSIPQKVVHAMSIGDGSTLVQIVQISTQ